MYPEQYDIYVPLVCKPENKCPACDGSGVVSRLLPDGGGFEHNDCSECDDKRPASTGEKS